MPLALEGRSLIGFGLGATGGRVFTGIDPATRAELAPGFHSCSAAEVDRAAALAVAAAPSLARLSGLERARLLRAIADRIESCVDALVVRAQSETALPEARLRSEIGRTTGQLRLFGEVAEQGDWVDARIDTAQPERKPLPRPDHRSMLRPLGPVVVFGASNFPFAFSVAGGDTASALAAGTPVIVKAHPAHPGTSELVGRLIVEAVRERGLPEGTFALLFDFGYSVGQALVQHPLVRAVAFTGSRRGGQALMDLVVTRAEPIPMFLEMGSINPVFVLPEALAERGDAIADGLGKSVTLGVGQFCTNPGLVVLQRSPAADRFVETLGRLLAATPEAPMLTPGIHSAYRSGVEHRARQRGVRLVAAGQAQGPCGAAAALFATDSATFLQTRELHEELFGPSTLVVLCPDETELLAVARSLDGSLTATVHGAPDEAMRNAALLEILAERAGRVLWGGFPTGVEVSHAMVHGGPFPATSDSRSTSVGTRAILRFARPVCWQGCPDATLPPELQDHNPRGIERLVNGRRTREPVARV